MVPSARATRALLLCALVVACERSVLAPEPQAALVGGVDGQANVLPPQPPTFSATATTAQVVLTWADGPDETSYQLQRGLAPDANPPANWVLLPDQPANTATYTDAGVAAQTRYLYRVRGCNAEGCSGFRYLYITTNAPPPPPPPQPSTLSATATTTQVVLTWTDGADETSYKLERGLAPASDPVETWVNLPDQAANATTYTDLGVAASTRYLYRIRACNTGGCSGYRYLYVTTGTPPTLPPQPSTLAATTTAAQVVLSWTDGPDETSYKLERGLAPASDPVETWVNLPDQAANAITYTDLGVAASTRYLYRIRACNAAGCSGYRYLYVTTNAPPPPPPPQPSTFSADPSSGNVALTWTDGPDETSYKLERGVAPDANPVQTWVNLPDQAANAITYTDTGTSPATRYLYRIRACNAGGCSGYRYLYVTTITPPPAQPGSFVADGSSGVVVLTWNDVATETSYQIGRALAPVGGPEGSYVGLPDRPANSTTYTDTGVAPATRYRYRIRACNTGGCSLYNTFYATTPTPPTPPFNIELIFVNTPTPTELAAFQAAEARWEQVITADVPDFGSSLPAACGNPAITGPVDDLKIYVVLEAIDGGGGILGSAGPCYIRGSNAAPTRFPISGRMRFDTADLAFMSGQGILVDVVLHEMGHVLGVGTLWDPLSSWPSQTDFLHMTGAGQDSYFNGTGAISAFNSIGGASYVGNKVPVENTGGAGTMHAHWRESVFNNELMTGWVNLGSNPMSSVTIASLGDHGYSVDLTKADAYTLPGPGALSFDESVRIRLVGDVLDGPIYTIEPNGTIGRVR
jgi:hypothetical protein